MTIEEIRVKFESSPKEFFGGNTLTREGEGYASSYVDMKWSVYKEIYLLLLEELSR